MAKRFHESIHEQGMEYIHSQEQQDGAVIHEDRSAMSLLPQNVVIKEFLCLPCGKNDCNSVIIN